MDSSGAGGMCGAAGHAGDRGRTVAADLFPYFSTALRRGQTSAAVVLCKNILSAAEMVDASYAEGDVAAEALLIASIFFIGRDDFDANAFVTDLARFALRPASSRTQRECFGECLNAIQAAWQLDVNEPRAESLVAFAKKIEQLPTPSDPEATKPSRQELPVYKAYWRIVSVTAGDERRQAEELWAGAQNLYSQGEHEYFFSMCSLIYQQFSDSSDVVARNVSAQALYGLATTFELRGDTRQELEAYDVVVDRFDQLVPAVAFSLFNKAIRLWNRGEDLHAVACYEHLISRFSRVPDVNIRIQVAKSLLNRSVAFSKFARPDLALADLNALLADYRADDQPELQRQCALALWNKALLLGDMGRTAEAIPLIDELIKNFCQSTDPQIQAAVANALGTRAEFVPSDKVNPERS